MIIAGHSKHADCASVQEAVDLAASHGDFEIFIEEGFYEERVEIHTNGLRIHGAGAEKTIVSGHLYGFMPSSDIGKLGTFRSYTMLVDASDVQISDLTIENTAGAGPEIGQAIALYADGNHLLFERLRLLGWQDTLFTGPLPPKEIEKNGFIGPKQFAPRINGYQFYKDCYIEGDVDFIFGSASVYFLHCVLFQKDREKKRGTGPNSERPCKGYATAASTPEGQEWGYVFEDCRFESDCPKESCYLGRPWRNFAKVSIVRCYLGPQITREGFHNWNKTEAEQTVSFTEYRNFGPGADSHARAPFVRELSDSEYLTLKERLSSSLRL